MEAVVAAALVDSGSPMGFFCLLLFISGGRHYGPSHEILINTGVGFEADELPLCVKLF
jgi:hypothetical protein